MELDELKSIWTKNSPGFQMKGAAELALMLKGNSRSVVDKLKKSVWFELIITIVAGIGLLIYAFTLPDGSLKWTTISILVLFAVYLFYFIKKLLLLNKFNADENLRENLQRLIQSLQGYLRFYKLSYTILYPVYFALGVLFGALKTGSDKFFQILTQPRTIVILSVTGLVLLFISTWFTNWYLRKLYGKHLDKLQSVLSELNATAADQ
jgi:hypothetical protein